MKIVQLVPRLNSGGVERGVLEVVSALVEQGHEALVVSAGGRMVGELQKRGGQHTTMQIAAKSPLTIRSVPKLAAFFKREQPAIVHPRSRLPAWLTWYALKLLTKENRPRLVTSVHGLHSVSSYSSIIGKGELVECVSESARTYLLENYPKVDSDRVRVVRRGVDENKYNKSFRPAPEWMQSWRSLMSEINPNEWPLILLPGRITRLKGHLDLFAVLEDLAKIYCNCVALVVGGHDESHTRYIRELEKRRDDSSVLKERVRFLGERTDLREIMAVSDIVLSLSGKAESFGRTVLEALSLGTAVVGYDHGGVGEILGEVFPDGSVAVGDTGRVAQKIVQLLSRRENPVNDHEMTLATMCESTIAMYEELAG